MPPARYAIARWGMGMRSHFCRGDRMVGNGDAIASWGMGMRSHFWGRGKGAIAY
ncbi:hypothetical protein [Microseira wollei]|uniref:hypothetical protein n=1 Tax=Microseira wollei TaxID=467598 RepID=UPI001CFEE5E8|nr:hypothetical protein [Microseira wollei]